MGVRSLKSPAVYERRLKHITIFLSALIIFVALSVLIGWTTGNPYLKSIIPGLVSMNPATAICFILAGTILVLSQREAASRLSHWQVALACFIAAVGIAKIFFYSTGFDLHVDKFLFADRLNGNSMAPNSAIAFMMSGSALACLSFRRTVPLGQILAFAVTVFAWMALLGYTYSSVSFYKLSSYIPMALHTAAAFVLLGVAMICSRPSHFAQILASGSGGSLMAKRLLPASFLIPSVFGVLRILGEKEGLYNTSFGVTLHAMCNIVVFFCLIALSARAIHKMHLAQLRKESRLNTQYFISRILAEAGSVEEALPVIVDQFGTDLGWQASSFWTLDKEQKLLRNHYTWQADSNFSAFTEASKNLAIQTGGSLPGRVWASSQVVWIPDISKDPGFVRKAAAAQCALRSAFGFPIIVDNEVLGIIDFCACEVRPYDAELVKVAQAIGLQIGFFIKRRQGDEDLKKARDQALQASHAKSEFLAVMSHEIRTPMNAIVGMADLLSEARLSKEQMEYIKILQRAGDTLLTLINDILDLSKVEAGHTELEEAPFDLRDFIERTTEFMAVRAHQKGIELTSRVGPNIAPFFVGDVNRLRQILVNLIGNAIKFTEKGEVVVQVKKADGIAVHAGRAKLHFSVSDTGIGIHPDKQQLIFSPFVQADSSTTRKFGGTGLGLSISKKLVDLMKGTLQVESAEGLGATFFFELDLETAGDASLPSNENLVCQLPRNGLRNIRVLVVDDNSTNRLILREILTSEGMCVTEAEGGREALIELERSAARGQQYQLLLLDCRMPLMDGFTLAEKIKTNASYNALMIMMLTSDHRNGDIARAGDLGLESYLIKPIKKTQLLGTIEKVLRQQPAVEEVPRPQPAAEAPPSEGLRILLVDDSEDNRTLILAYLKKTPHKVDTAENGQIAFDKVTGGGTPYDLVFMDVHMPVMDGYTTARAIRKWEKERGLSAVKAVPIIALTANALKEDAQKSLNAGCSGHLTKPIKKAELLAVLDAPQKFAAA